MDACYSHTAIAHPYPGGFSRSCVEKVWLHGSFLATRPPETSSTVSVGECLLGLLRQLIADKLLIIVDGLR